jgi:hypothetical protein
MKNRGARLGVATMCIGMGQGVATVFESVPIKATQYVSRINPQGVHVLSQK